MLKTNPQLNLVGSEAYPRAEESGLPQGEMQDLAADQRKERRRVVHRAWVARNLERRRSQMRKWNERNKEKVQNDFREWSKKNLSSRREYKRNWNRSHPDSIKEWNRKQYLKHKPERIEWQKNYQRRNWPRIQKRMKAYTATYYAKNKERILKRTSEWARQNKQARTAIAKRYRLKYPEKYKAQIKSCRVRRKARERGAAIDGGKACALIRQWKMSISFQCEYCKKWFPTEKLTVDHIIPISKGGHHSVENICHACINCNSSKYDKLPSEFINQMKGQPHAHV